MKFEKPVFIQIVEMIEDDILSGRYAVDDMIISTTQISKLLSVNPTTSVKTVSILNERGILYKKRGLGMAVTQEAKCIITQERRDAFFEQFVPEFIGSADKIGITLKDLIRIIKEHDDDRV